MSEIQFATPIVDDKGIEVTRADPVTAEQLDGIVKANEAGSVTKFLAGLLEKSKDQFTLAEACCTALKVPLEADKTQDAEDIYKRGRLVRKIRRAAKDGTPIVLKQKQIDLIKGRVAKCFTDASFVLSVNELLDPKVAEDEDD